MDDPIDVETAKEDLGRMMCMLFPAIAEDAQLRVIAVRSRSSTRAVVITVVQEGITIDHGVLSLPTMIETENGATASNDVAQLNQSSLLSVLQKRRSYKLLQV